MSLTVGSAGRGVFLFVHAHDFHGGVSGGGEHVPVVEKRVFGVADVDERGLETGIEIFDAALVDAADHAAIGLAFDFKLLEAAVDEEGDALFERFGIDDQLAIGALLFLEDREDLLEERALFGTFLGAGFEFGGVDGSGFRLGGGIDEFLVVFGGDVGRDAGGLRLIAHGACRVGYARRYSVR